MNSRIAVVLTRKEGFSADRFGAIALTVEQYVRHSAFQDQTEVLGMPEPHPRESCKFQGITPQDRWWRRRTHGFELGCAAHLARVPPRHIDVHNRVESFFFLAKKFPEAAVSLWFHNDPQGMSGSGSPGQRQRIVERARLVICVSEWVRARFIEGLSRHQERVVVLPNAIDPGTVPVHTKQRLILCAGRIIPEKGTLPFAQAAARALARLPGWQAGIIGSDHPATPWYTQQVATAVAGAHGRVEMMGFLPHEQLMAMFSRAAIAVVPSQWDEPFARTALEAMASGCAVIASRRGGLSEVVGDAGLLLEAPEPEALERAITTLVRDEHRRESLQCRATARVATAFDIHRWAAQLDDWRREIDPELAAHRAA